jgi:hypothetical protein
MDQDDSALALRLQPWTFNNYADLYVSPEHADELRALLTSAGLANNRVVHASGGHEVLEIIGLGVANATFWPSLFAVLKVFITRHKGKKVHVTVAGTPLEMEGYSERQAERLMNAAMELHAQQQQRWDAFSKPADADQAQGQRAVGPASADQAQLPPPQP